jgi:hypothetical protein
MAVHTAPLIAADGKPIHILYIMGTGRSATTIQEILLANNPDVVGIGEFTHFFHDGLIQHVDCACGEDVDHCSFWSTIMEQAQWQEQQASRLDKLFSSIASHKKFLFHYLQGVHSDIMKEYGEQNRRLFGAVATTSNAHYIVDSSKYAGRALALARLFPASVSIICMTRSPEGLLTAFRKTPQSIARNEQKPKSPIATMLYYMYVLLCFRLTLHRACVPSVHIAYEDVRSNPQAVLLAIERALQLPCITQAVRQDIEQQKQLDVGHIVTGNRLRKKGSVVFQQGAVRAEKLVGYEPFCAYAMRAWRTLLKMDKVHETSQ